MTLYQFLDQSCRHLYTPIFIRIIAAASDCVEAVKAVSVVVATELGATLLVFWASPERL